MSDLISTADIAGILGLARGYVTDVVVKRADFPAPALRLSQKTVRWYRADVLGWIDAQRIRAVRQSGPVIHGSRPATATGHDAR
jgi:predicted DNA-binding transcriptional regulator AlpA